VSTVSGASLIAATLNLQLVQSVLSAIRTADLYSASHSFPRGAWCCDRYCPGPITPQTRYLPRPVIHPRPRYLPRPVLHPRPRIEPLPPPPPAPSAKVPHITAGPPPPWKTLPWQEPAATPNVVKMFVRAPDTVTKGTLIDLFL